MGNCLIGDICSCECLHAKWNDNLRNSFGLKPHKKVTTCIASACLKLLVAHKWTGANSEWRRETWCAYTYVCTQYIYIDFVSTAPKAEQKTAPFTWALFHKNEPCLGLSLFPSGRKVNEMDKFGKDELGAHVVRNTVHVDVCERKDSLPYHMIFLHTHTVLSSNSFRRWNRFFVLQPAFVRFFGRLDVSRMTFCVRKWIFQPNSQHENITNFSSGRYRRGEMS